MLLRINEGKQKEVSCDDMSHDTSFHFIGVYSRHSTRLSLFYYLV